MSDQPVVMAVATYRSKAAADWDFCAVRDAKHEREADHVAAAVVEKGANGQLIMDCHDNSARHLAWGGALLGGVFIVIAAPLGIHFLAPIIGTGTAWAGVGAIVDHFWHNIPKNDLRLMSDLLESDQAALVVVAVDHTGEDIEALLSNATTKIITDASFADFEAEFSNAIEEANMTG
jgi:uncharacterized membrane protein